MTKNVILKDTEGNQIAPATTTEQVYHHVKGTNISQKLSDFVDFDGNAELMDIRKGYDGKEYDTAGNAVRGQLEQVFQSVGNGKEMIAAAITDKGVETAADDTFEVMKTNIDNISTGLPLPTRFAIRFKPIDFNIRVKEYTIKEEKNK